MLILLKVRFPRLPRHPLNARIHPEWAQPSLQSIQPTETI
jgi:hypothetical protein